ncbi:MAG: hypothetical protein ACP5MH_05990, partial [Thermoproteus sp.]
LSSKSDTAKYEKRLKNTPRGVGRRALLRAAENLAPQGVEGVSESVLNGPRTTLSAEEIPSWAAHAVR